MADGDDGTGRLRLQGVNGGGGRIAQPQGALIDLRMYTLRKQLMME